MNHTQHIPYGFYERVIKRIIDIIISLLFLICFCWVYAIVGILIRVKLGSPIIFKQDRPGKDKKIFKLYKFRTMTDETDESGHLLPDSQRLTKFGRILRSTSLDELPELINVLKGEMSLIGPRPWSVIYLPYFTPEEQRRHEVRPGLTGLAQVNGRTAANWDERLKYDIVYVDHISFIMDVKVILLTVKKVFSCADIVEAGAQGSFHDYRRKQWEEGIVEKPKELVEK